MVVIVVLVLLEAGVIWGLRCWQDAHSPLPPLQLTEPATAAARSQWAGPH